MKKSRIILGASAVVLAIASAFTTKAKTAITSVTGGVFTKTNGPSSATVCTQFVTDCSLVPVGHTIFTAGSGCTQGKTVFTAYTGDNECKNILQVNRFEN